MIKVEAWKDIFNEVKCHAKSMNVITDNFVFAVV